MVAGCLSLSLRSNGVATCLSLSFMITGCLSLSFLVHGVAAYHLLSTMVADCPLLSLRSNAVAACLSLSPVVSGCLLLSLRSHGVAACLSLSQMVSGCFSLSLKVPCSCCMSLTVFYDCWLSLPVSPSAMDLLLVSDYLFQFHGVSICNSLSLMVARCRLYECH